MDLLKYVRAPDPPCWPRGERSCAALLSFPSCVGCFSFGAPGLVPQSPEEAESTHPNSETLEPRGWQLRDTRSTSRAPTQGKAVQDWTSGPSFTASGMDTQSANLLGAGIFNVTVSIPHGTVAFLLVGKYLDIPVVLLRLVSFKVCHTDRIDDIPVGSPRPVVLQRYGSTSSMTFWLTPPMVFQSCCRATAQPPHFYDACPQRHRCSPNRFAKAGALTGAVQGRQ